MNVGMLWFDNDHKAALNAKIERAATYYRDKYGKAPTLCYVHPSMLPEVDPASQEKDAKLNSNGSRSRFKAGGLEVRTSHAILPNHFWIGLNGTSGASSSET